MKTTTTLRTLFALGLALSACDENPKTPPLGSVSLLTTAAPNVLQGFATSDGWNVKYTQFLVHLSVANVAGNDGVLMASAADQLINVIGPEPGVLLAADNRVARAWENVNLQIGPATEESSLVGAVTEADRANMVANGYSLFFQATMTRGTETKTLRVGFTPNTKYDACTGPVAGVPTAGLVVPANGEGTATIGFAGDVFFFDNLVTRGYVLRGDPIAGADANGDGAIDNAELSEVTLEEIRTPTTTGLYEALPDVTDLNGFLNEQARSIVTFRETGSCTITAVAETP